MTPSDLRLLHRSAAGDAEAFEQFVVRYQAPLSRFLGASLTTADAQDVLQETFLAAWRAAGDFRGPDSARAWLYQIARRASYRHARRRAGEPDAMESLDVLADRAGWGAAAAPDFTEQLADRDLVERALAALSPDEREIIHLRDVEQWAGQEVAEMLELSLPAMKSRLHRARLRLAASLRKVMYGNA